MILTAYTNVPDAHVMPGNSIVFQDHFFLQGNDAPDTINVVFGQPTSPNWTLAGVATRAFPVTTARFHQFPDGLAFQLIGQRTVGEVFFVNSVASLATNPALQVQEMLTVTVQ